MKKHRELYREWVLRIVERMVVVKVEVEQRG